MWPESTYVDKQVSASSSIHEYRESRKLLPRNQVRSKSRHHKNAILRFLLISLGLVFGVGSLPVGTGCTIAAIFEKPLMVQDKIELAGWKITFWPVPGCTERAEQTQDYVDADRADATVFDSK